MICDKLEVEIKITNKEKLSSITDNIIKLAKLAKDNIEAENICNDIIKDFNGLFKLEVK